MALNLQQQRFVLEYLADPKRNATQAAIRAGYHPNRAKVTASEFLADPKFQAAIEEQLTKHLRSLNVDAEMVISGIVETIEKAKAAGQGAWQSQTILRGYELLGRYLGLFTDKVDVGADDKLIEQLLLGRKRAAGAMATLEEEPKENDDAEKKPN